jgi:hypothetical protein
MRRWSVLFGVLVGLQMMWVQLGWTDQVFVPTAVPGDEGTQACRDVQLAVQGAVGTETNPPYKNHGQYVSAASHAANPALQAGEITEACHSCIVRQFADSTPIENQESCGPDLCDFPGAPGWQNMVKVGGNGAFIPSATTAQACCQACVDDLNCAQWAFIGDNCSHNVPPSQCVAPTPSTVIESGMIRCP